MKTGVTESHGVTESPGVTGKPGAPGVVVAPGYQEWSVEPSPGYRVPVPVIKPELGPGMTGTCSESTGRLTDDC